MCECLGLGNFSGPLCECLHKYALGEEGDLMRNRGNAHEYINDDLCTDDARFDGRFDRIIRRCGCSILLQLVCYRLFSVFGSESTYYKTRLERITHSCVSMCSVEAQPTSKTLCKYAEIQPEKGNHFTKRCTYSTTGPIT